MSRTIFEIDKTQEKPTEKELKEMHEKTKAFHKDVLAQLYTIYGNPNPKPIKVVYCMSFFDESIPGVIELLRVVLPYVDRAELVYDQSVGTNLLDYIREQYPTDLADKIVFNYRKWDNHFSKQRNTYLDKINEGEWVIVSDPDELYDDLFLADMKKIMHDAEVQGFNILGINAHDITEQPNGETSEVISNWFKQLIFKFEEGVRYVGCVHETLLPGKNGWRAADLDKRYFYSHLKSQLEIKERGARNIFCGGGGNNVLDKNPMYVDWHKIANKLNINTWPEMRIYIRKGNINTDLLQLIVNHRNDAGWDWEEESRDPFIWYQMLHPKEVEGLKSEPQSPSVGSPKEIMAYVENCYIEVLGRNADQPGKENYTDAILRGVFKREEVPLLLKRSDEYKQKHPEETKEEEAK